MNYQTLTMQELKTLYLEHIDNSPADTGMPIGHDRREHCQDRKRKCPLCQAWNKWMADCLPLEREMKLRRRAGEF